MSDGETTSACCSGAATACCTAREPWIEGAVAGRNGPIPRVSGRLSRRERLEHLRCRLGAYRLRYTVRPGLYAIGQPGRGSEVLVSANYKLSFDHLRRAAAAVDAWILVLDTRGINVWCAAGKGTFGTEELLRRLDAVRLPDEVDHRRLVVPQLGAPGIAAHEVQRRSGFRVEYGPVRADDLPAWLAAGRRATPAMRRVRFGLADRLVLAPLELRPSLRKLAIFALGTIAFFAAAPSGHTPALVAARAAPFLALGGAALLAGGLLTPALLPVIPARSFALKGWLLGLATVGAATAVLPALRGSGPLLVAFAWVFFPAASSYLALLFTGSTPYTGISGVKKEMRVAIPLHLAAAAVSALLLAVQKVSEWRGA